MNSLNKYLTIDPNIDDWTTLTQVVQSGEYKAIAATHKGFKPYLDEGYLDSWTQQTGQITKTYVRKTQLERLLNYLSDLECNYIKDKEAANLLGFRGVNPLAGARQRANILDVLFKLCNSEGIDFEYFEKPFKETYMYINKSQLNHFLETHITLAEVYEKYNLNHYKVFSTAKKNNIVLKKFSTTIAHFFLKEDAEKFFKPLSEPPPEVYTKEETLEKLGASVFQLKKIRKEENLTPIKINGKTHYLKSEIDALLVKKQKIREEYCSGDEVIEILEMVYLPSNHIKAVKTTALMLLAVEDARVSVYSIKEVYEYKNKRTEQQLIDQAFEKEPLEAFYEILGIKQIEFSEKSKVTAKEWYEYCHTKLALVSGTQTNKRNLVNILVGCTELLTQLVGDKELYSFYSNEINLKFFSHLVNYKHQNHLYSFLIEFAGTMEFIATIKGSKHKIYDTTKLINPYEREVKARPKKVYSYDEYINLYDYAADMEHKNKAILGAEKLLKGKRDTRYHYSSAWLYILIHLTNAWRHTDILNIPTIDLNEIGTNTLEALKERDLSFEEANSIVNQLIKQSYIANKTGANIDFRIADDLILPVATAAVICAIIAKNEPVVGSQLQSHLIDFGTQKNDFKPKNTIYKVFFENFDESESIVFGNLKMCRTVLSLLYSVLVQKGRGGAALKLAQRLRAHSNEEITNIYLQIPQEELDRLCENLFNRKLFGYIPSLLSNILMGPSESYEEETQNIIKLSEKFGDVYKMESSAGFVNKVVAERQLVADKIFKMGIDEASALMFDINVNALPSCEEHIQCLVSEEGCQKPELDSCKSCPYAIPNFYALTAMAESIKTTIKEFVDEYEPTSFEGEKTRLLNFLYVEMDNFERAIQKFGKDEVFKFFAGGEDEYNSLLDLLDNMDAEEDFEKYLTYTPRFLS